MALRKPRKSGIFRCALALPTLQTRQCRPSGVIVVVNRQKHQEERDGGSDVDGVIHVASFDDLTRRQIVALYRSFDIVSFDDLSRRQIVALYSSFDIVSFDELSATDPRRPPSC